MALLIKGDEIDKLVERYCTITGMKNKSEAVRSALAKQIEMLTKQETLSERVASLQRRASREGFLPLEDDAESDKRFMDDVWGEA